MKNVFVLISCFVIITLSSAPVIAEESAESSDDARSRFPFTPVGTFYVWQYTPSNSVVNWEYDATVMMEIFRAERHNVWFGVEYRNQAANNTADVRMTPFDPRTVDAYQLLGYQYRITPRLITYMYTTRVCYHEVDEKTTPTTILTHPSIGIGTISPPEMNSRPRHIRTSNHWDWDVFLHTGTFIQGGGGEIFGNRSLYQWETHGYATVTVPLGNFFMLETAMHVNHLLLITRQEDRHRWKFRTKLSLLFPGNHGTFTFFMERVHHDDYPERWEPVGVRFGFGNRF